MAYGECRVNLLFTVIVGEGGICVGHVEPADYLVDPLDDQAGAPQVDFREADFQGHVVDEGKRALALGVRHRSVLVATEGDLFLAVYLDEHFIVVESRLADAEVETFPPAFLQVIRLEIFLTQPDPVLDAP